jgi:hypothetical protein
MIRLFEHITDLISQCYRVYSGVLFRRERVDVERCHKRPLQCWYQLYERPWFICSVCPVASANVDLRPHVGARCRWVVSFTSLQLNPLYPGGWQVPRGGYDAVTKEKIFVPITRSSSRSVVTILTELSQLLCCIDIIITLNDYAVA